MAKYFTGEQKFYDAKRGVLHPKNAIITLPDDEKPSRTWQALDKAAVDGLKSVGVKDPKIIGAPADAEVVEEGPVAVAEVGKAKRASDLSPV